MINGKHEEIDLPFGQHYSCPNCKTHPPDKDDGYRRNGKKYPVYLNERKGWAGDEYHDWEEIHYCSKCKIEYYYHNGAF